jgi:bifunctional DNA-binding transcriptional regulator/antitoxin component of YhaV-PrlF toxin-antitoxin module
MPILKLHDDGWLSLPAGLRQALGLNSGDRLEAELVDGALMLRPVSRTRRPAQGEETTVPVGAEAATTLPLAADATPTQRKPGRPRKPTAVADDDAAAPKKARGRPRKAALGLDTAAAGAPKTILGPPRLLKKADLETRTTPTEPVAPVVASSAKRIRPDRASQTVERRPFRNVEIRTLGPVRGHNKHRISAKGTYQPV